MRIKFIQNIIDCMRGKNKNFSSNHNAINENDGFIIPVNKNQRSFLSHAASMEEWHQRNYLGHSPQFIKEQVLLHYGIKDAQWIETGTYLGTTTGFLAERYPCVFTIEPEPKLFKGAEEKFSGQNVEVLNGTSEEILPSLLVDIEGDVNFWLDGHYSAGITFQGGSDCPIRSELETISSHLNRFSSVSILIDDVRCFLDPNRDDSYPPLDELVDWARSHRFTWGIEHDILIMQRLI